MESKLWNGKKCTTNLEEYWKDWHFISHLLWNPLFVHTSILRCSFVRDKCSKMRCKLKMYNNFRKFKWMWQSQQSHYKNYSFNLSNSMSLATYNLQPTKYQWIIIIIMGELKWRNGKKREIVTIIMAFHFDRILILTFSINWSTTFICLHKYKPLDWHKVWILNNHRTKSVWLDVGSIDIHLVLTDSMKVGQF